MNNEQESNYYNDARLRHNGDCCTKEGFVEAFLKSRGVFAVWFCGYYQSEDRKRCGDCTRRDSRAGTTSAFWYGSRARFLVWQSGRLDEADKRGFPIPFARRYGEARCYRTIRISYMETITRIITNEPIQKKQQRYVCHISAMRLSMSLKYLPIRKQSILFRRASSKTSFPLDCYH